MTVGATNTFTEQRDLIIADALTMVGAVGPGQTPTGEQITHAARVLNALVKSVDAEGTFLWRTIRRTLTTTASTASYTLGTDVLDVDEPLRYVISGQTTGNIIRLTSRKDYMMISDRTQTGVPSQCFVEKVLPNAVTITFWPVPSATSDSIEYTAYIRAADFTTGSDTPDFDSRWIEPLVFGLASRLAYSYSQPDLAPVLGAQYEQRKLQVIEDGTERGSVTLVPWMNSSNY